MSGEDGTFELPPSAIGCTAIAEHGEYASSEAADVVEGRPLRLQLKAGGSIEGVVVNERGEALPSFTLGIESFSPARGLSFDHGGARTFEDPRGAFRWDGLAPGTYVLTAAGDGSPPARSSPASAVPMRSSSDSSTAPIGSEAEMDAGAGRSPRTSST